MAVMDYPHPAEKLREDGSIDLSEAYPQHIGEWDKVAINYGYRMLPRGDEPAELARILNDTWDKDLRYFTNQDTDIHPRVEQWSNSVNQAAMMRLMKLRRSRSIASGSTPSLGAPVATIEEPRCQSTCIIPFTRGGIRARPCWAARTSSMRCGDGRTAVKWETAANQRKALEAPQQR
jgi:hypothetical protein